MNKKLRKGSSQPTSSRATQEKTASPSTQPQKQQKTLRPKGDKAMGKATGGSKEALAPSSEELECEITRRDTGVVYCSDSSVLRPFTQRAKGEVEKCNI